MKRLTSAQLFAAPKRAVKTKARLERAKLVMVAARERAAETAQQCAGPAFNDAPSYRAAEAPIGREVQREVLSTTIVITNTIVQVLNSSMLASLTSQRRD